MAGKSGARVFTEADKAAVLTALAANGGNVKRTARDTGVAPATIRRWRGQADHGQGPSPQAITQAVGAFADRAESIRDKALSRLEALIDAGQLTGAQLITAVGVLDDKVTRAKGLDGQRVDVHHHLPPREELRELMAGVVQQGIAAAERRHEEIVDAEIVAELPAATA